MTDKPDPLQRLTDVQQEIEAALAPEQKPVLQDIEQYRMQMASISTAAIGYWKEGDGIHPDYDTTALRDVAMLYAKYDALYKAQPEQKPVAWLSTDSIGERYLWFSKPLDNDKAQPLYTVTPQREWQGLTDEEYNRLVMEHLGPHALTGGKMSVYDAFLLAIRATEAKLKEKND